jgi:hypothetical protein
MLCEAIIGSFSPEAYGGLFYCPFRLSSCRAAAPSAAWTPCRCAPAVLHGGAASCSKFLIVEIPMEKVVDQIAFRRLFEGLLYKILGHDYNFSFARGLFVNSPLIYEKQLL